MYETVVALVVALHFVFIGYVVVGGFLAVHWRRTIWLHVPAAIWGIGIATNRVDCPLTWLERWARARAAMAPLPPDGFIAHYITGVIYPVSWLGGVQIGAFVVVAVSWAVFFCPGIRRRRQCRPAARSFRLR